MNTKAQYISRLVTQLSLGGGERLVDGIVAMEKDRGFEVVRPGDAEWLPQQFWKPSSICSIDGNRVRIVLVEAKAQKSGAFKQLVADIQDLDMVPVVVEPHERLAGTLASWGWKHRRVGHGFTGENVWYPRR